MPKPYVQALADITGVAANAAIDIEHVENAAVIVGGTFVGTWTLQVSPDGTMWVDHATIAAKTAAFAGLIGYRVKQVRINCTAHTSGTIESFVSGDDEDRAG